jgi:hypothetical protein
MKKITLIVIIATFIALNSYSQSNSSAAPMGIETLSLLPKRGMEDKFEAAVLAHMKKYHPDGPYVAGLRKIEYGPKAGWYVWVMGPTSYGTFDKPLGKDNGHEQDWNTTIEPLVEEYGATGLWGYNTEFSYGRDIFLKSKHYEVWSVDLKPGKYYRFKAIAEKLKKTYESIGKTAFLVLDNNLHTTGGPDVSLIWSFDTYADWANDYGPVTAYEKLYGEGSWQRMLDEWMDIINDYDSEIRTIIR